MYCTILCTKEEDCIGAKAEGGSCYLYKDAIAGLHFHEASQTSSGIWLRWADQICANWPGYRYIR